MAMTNKCAHPVSSCPVPEKWMYCSAQYVSGTPAMPGMVANIKAAKDVEKRRRWTVDFLESERLRRGLWDGGYGHI